MSDHLRVWAYIRFSYSIPDLGNSPKHELTFSPRRQSALWVRCYFWRSLCFTFRSEEWSESFLERKVYDPLQVCGQRSIKVFTYLNKCWGPGLECPLLMILEPSSWLATENILNFIFFKRKGGINAILKGNLALYTKRVISTMSRKGGTWLVERCIPDLLVGMAPYRKYMPQTIRAW